jgi:hypothetical protein
LLQDFTQTQQPLELTFPPQADLSGSGLPIRFKPLCKEAVACSATYHTQFFSAFIVPYALIRPDRKDWSQAELSLAELEPP